MSDTSHIDETGAARMVDVSAKAVTRRVARASGTLRMSARAFDAIVSGELAKGDALAVARVAGIQAAKRTPDLLPLCHPLPLEHAAVRLEPDSGLPGVRVETEIVVTARTGAEMEALTSASVTLLALYDMVKALDRTMWIEDVRLEHKSGGASGAFEREP